MKLNLGSSDTLEVDAITEAQIVRIERGDILALVSENALTDSVASYVAQVVNERVPDGVQVLVLDRMRFEVLRCQVSEEPRKALQPSGATAATGLNSEPAGPRS